MFDNVLLKRGVSQGIAMSSRIHIRKGRTLMVAFGSLMFLYMIWTIVGRTGHAGKTVHTYSVVDPGYQRVTASFDKNWLQTTCLQGRLLLATLDDLPAALEILETSQDPQCRAWFEIMKSIVTVTKQDAPVVFPSTFETKVKKWLGNNEVLFKEALKQSVIFFYNKYTREQNVYNSIRNKRPMAVPDVPEQEYVNQISEETAKSCDFCQHTLFTAKDVFGRIESNHSFSCSNAFKLDTWHALVILKQHHPLKWNFEQYYDFMDTTQKWYRTVHGTDSKYKFPAFVWDLLPHAGASQVHPHIHTFLDRDSYQGVMENWRVSARQYSIEHPGRNYFTDLVLIHAALGLTVQYGNSFVFANIVPRKDHEIVIISEKPDRDFFVLLYFVLRAFIDDMEKLCLSSGVAFPSLGGRSSEDIPVFARVVTRGAVAEVRSDISSLDLFLAANINTDPYEVIEVVRKSIEKRSRQFKS